MIRDCFHKLFRPGFHIGIKFDAHTEAERRELRGKLVLCLRIKNPDLSEYFPK